MTQPPAALLPAFTALRAGNVAAARTHAEAAVSAEPDNAVYRSFAGMLACQSGDLDAGVRHLRAALAHAPEDKASRINLALSLLELGQKEEAETVASAAPDDPKLARILGFLCQERGAFAEAEDHYTRVVDAIPQDWESWNNLANVRASLGKIDGAIAAFDAAIRINPKMSALYVNLSKALSSTDRHLIRQNAMRRAAFFAPDDPAVQEELGLAEAANRNFVAAEDAYRRAIALADGFSPAWLELGLMLENLNRIDDLEALVSEAASRGVEAGEIGFLKAWVLRRKGDAAGALALAETAPETISAVRRAQLVADMADRVGDAPRAYAAYVAMNDAAAQQFPAPSGEADYRADVASLAARLTPDRIARWNTARPSLVPPSPWFLVGFPRSGTTLLDTLIMNLPQFQVLEEQPMLAHAERGLPDATQLGALDSEALSTLRGRYFEALEQVGPTEAERIIIDKHPLHMAKVPLIHRLFPDTRLILVERHPCDVVLSCFMANFGLNRSMRHFGTLEGAARLYDTVFTCWTRAVDLLPVKVHRVRYERMVADLAAEMRPLLAFLDVEWTDAVLDNTGAAAQRDHIRTASYAQVGEPIYARAAGRWERYRPQLEPVLPLLAPWAERMGYEI